MTLLTTDNSHSERFQELLGDLKQEVDGLKSQIDELQRQNDRLHAELKERQNQESDIFSSMKEPERMALKHQVKGLIAKIDEHLEAQQ